MENLLLIKPYNSKKELKPIEFITTVMYLMSFEKKEYAGKINSEHIANRAWELDKEKFGWQLYPYPNIDRMRRYFENMRDLHLVYGHRGEDLNKEGYTLTEKGAELAKKYIHLFIDENNKRIFIEPANNGENVNIQNALNKIKKSKFYNLFIYENFDEIEHEMSIYHVADFLGTTTNNLGRLNKKFNDVKKWSSSYEIDNPLPDFLMFIEKLFEDKINKDNLIKFHLNTSKSKNKSL